MRWLLHHLSLRFLVFEHIRHAELLSDDVLPVRDNRRIGAIYHVGDQYGHLFGILRDQPVPGGRVGERVDVRRHCDLLPFNSGWKAR
ncbi:hypothetical protein BDW60DRAFT_186311 [Aspergillus nidulans var. acristatus]